MNVLRISLQKCVSMMGGVVSSLLVLLTVCLCAFGLNGVFRSERATAVSVDVVTEKEDAYLHQICSRMEDGGSIALRFVDGRTAATDLIFGRAEGVLTLPDDFTESAMAGEPAYTYQSSASSSSASYVLEQFSSAILSLRIRETCIEQAMEQGATREEAASRVDAAWTRISEQQGSGYVLSLSETTTEPVVHGVFGHVLAKANGFVAMILMFLYASALQWLIMEDVKQVSVRLFSRRLGRLFGKGTDLLALLLIGVAVFSACGALLGTLSLRYVLCFLCYCVFLSGFFLLLSTVLHANGQVQLFVPFVTLATGFAGGCMFNLSAVSAVWQKAALFTPQGLLLFGLDSGSFFPALVLAAIGIVSFLASLLPQRNAA